MQWFIAVSLLLTGAGVLGERTFLLMVDSGSYSLPQLENLMNDTLSNVSSQLNITLNYQTRDSECDVVKGLQIFHEEIENDALEAIIGCGCSAVTEEIAKLSPFKNISVISYASPSVVLSDKSLYRTLIRTIPSDEHFVPAIAALMESYKWKQISVFTEEQPQYLKLSQQFRELRQSRDNISRVNVFSFSSKQLDNFTTFASQIRYVFDDEPHIYVVNAKLKSTVFILCTAYSMRRYTPNYAWILLRAQQNKWWLQHMNETNCTDSDMQQVVNRSLVLVPLPNETMLGEYDDKTYLVDAVWTLAHVLNRCKPEMNSSICRSVVVKSVSNFTYNQRNVNIVEGERITSTVIVQQHQMNESTLSVATVGLVVPSGPDSYNYSVINSSTYAVWPEGIPPDGTPLQVVTVEYTSTVVVRAIIDCVLVTFIIVCLGFTILFRNTKIVKLTSPKLNYVMILGCVCLTLAALPPINSTNVTFVTVQCTIDRIGFAIGYDICIAVAVVKAWRVVYIFKFSKPGKKPVKDWHLLLVVGGIVLVEVACIVLPFIPLTLVYDDITLVMDKENTPKLNDQGVLEIYYLNACGGTVYFLVFTILTISYKFILHTIGVVLVFFTKNIKVDVLNDYRYNTTIIIITSVLLVVTVIIANALAVYANILNVAWGFVVLLYISSYLGLTFIPKMIALYNDPEGKDVFKRIQLLTTGTHLDRSIKKPTTTTSTAGTTEGKSTSNGKA